MWQPTWAKLITTLPSTYRPHPITHALFSPDGAGVVVGIDGS